MMDGLEFRCVLASRILSDLLELYRRCEAELNTEGYPVSRVCEASYIVNYFIATIKQLDGIFGSNLYVDLRGMVGKKKDPGVFGEFLWEYVLPLVIEKCPVS